MSGEDHNPAATQHRLRDTVSGFQKARSGATYEARNQRDHKERQEDKEQDLCDTCGRTSDAAETERASDDRDDEKNKGPV